MGLLGPKRHTDRTGDVSEAAIVKRLLQVGYVILTPSGKQHRYDLVIEDADGQFWRVQCKTAWSEQDGAYIRFNASNVHYFSINGTKMRAPKRRDYRGQIEYFAVYYEALDKVYLIPVNNVGKVSPFLRLTPTKNNQEKNVRWAADYEL
ncbi:MAG TPA: group I intron-associated PD-(D/E)XK endonuclease [Ktedonosporobacter sp.]|nr:group I intron-associated PD-(D/E)XK endonuclease [Ktedonosporobacter sp.]